MKIVVTGSLGSISKPLIEVLIRKKHDVFVVSSKNERRSAIEAMGAKAEIGSVEDITFLTKAFQSADAVYLMEPLKATSNLVTYWTSIANNFAQSILVNNIRKIVHLSSVGAHINHENPLLAIHYRVEQVLRKLPLDIDIKFMRPVSFYTNAYRYIPSIAQHNAIFGTYSGDQKELWVSPLDIAHAIAEEFDLPFKGREVRYIASEEISLKEMAVLIGQAIDKPELEWIQISVDKMRNQLLSSGTNSDFVERSIQMQELIGSGKLFEDYYKNPPKRMGKVPFKAFLNDFAKTYHDQAKQILS